MRSADSKTCNVIGAGGHGKVVVRLLQLLGSPVSAVFDDDPKRIGQTLLGVPVVGPIDSISRCGDVPAVIAIGDNHHRCVLAERLSLSWKTLVHPSAYVDPDVQLAPGVVVLPNAVIHVEARVGAHAIVNSGAIVEHDSRVGAYAHLAPGCRLGGSVQIGEGTLMGIGSSALPGIRVGAWSKIGAGAVVTHDLPETCTAVGIPARVTDENVDREITATRRYR